MPHSAPPELAIGAADTTTGDLRPFRPYLTARGREGAVRGPQWRVPRLGRAFQAKVESADRNAVEAARAALAETEADMSEVDSEGANCSRSSPTAQR